LGKLGIWGDTIQMKIDGMNYEIYTVTGKKLQETTDIRVVRGLLKFAVMIGDDANLIVYANGKDITKDIIKEV